MLMVLEELEERAEKRFEEGRKNEENRIGDGENRLAREEKMEENMMHVFTTLLQTITPHPQRDPYRITKNFRETSCSSIS